MGQYHILVNVDRREYLHPHRMGDGLKLLEFGQGLTMQGLAVLLSTSNGLGGGDLIDSRHGVKSVPPPTRWSTFNSSLQTVSLDAEDRDTIVGRWAGDRIAVVGDYDDFSPYRFLYQHAQGPEDDHSGKDCGWCKAGDAPGWTDISLQVMNTLCGDAYIREEVSKNTFYQDYMRRITQSTA